MIAVIVSLGVMFAVFGFVIYGSLVKNKWGINLAAVTCPRCGIALPRVRTPQTQQQAMWGGCTCPSCGAGLDKWGREVATS